MIGWFPLKIYDEVLLHLLKSDSWCALNNPIVCQSRKSLSVRRISSLLKIPSRLMATSEYLLWRGSAQD